MTPPGPVLVVGCGLLGTSVGLACRRAGLEVWLTDVEDAHVRTATALGAGTPFVPGQQGEPGLVVVAVPPDAVVDEVIHWVRTTPAPVTDVASVKALPLSGVSAAVGAPALARYVGSHPMAGSERSGPLAGSASLFEGRPWAVVAHARSDPGAVAAVRDLATCCGSFVTAMSAEEHDRAVATTSHLPHMLAALVAGRLQQAPPDHLLLSGQGVRDVTRVAGSDPGLWTQILLGNRDAVGGLLDAVVAELDQLRDALAAGRRDDVTDVLLRGVEGTRMLAGKHGRPAPATATLEVALPDTPGELARLFADAGEAGVNVEDVAIDHDPGRTMGRVQLTVAADAADALQSSLRRRDWDVQR